MAVTIPQLAMNRSVNQYNHGYYFQVPHYIVGAVLVMPTLARACEFSYARWEQYGELWVCVPHNIQTDKPSDVRLLERMR